MTLLLRLTSSRFWLTRPGQSSRSRMPRDSWGLLERIVYAFTLDNHRLYF